MLDQNTDRMWYVIGAVIIGAAIILILNGTVPEMFASVGETFKAKTENVRTDVSDITMTDGAMPQKREEVFFDMQDIQPWAAEEFKRLSDTSIQLSADEKYYGGFSIPASYFELGETYTLAFDIKKISGDIEGIGGHLHITDEAKVTIDGNPVDLWEYGARGTSEVNDWTKGVTYPNDEAVHHVELTFTKNQRVEDEKVYLQINRTNHNEEFGGYEELALDYTVRISNVTLYHHK